MAAAGVVDPGVVDPYAGVRRRVAQSLGPSGQQGGGWEAPLGTPSPSMGGPTPAAPFTPSNPTPNGGGWEDPTGAPAPTMGPPPVISSSPTEGIPPPPTIESSPTEGLPPPPASTGAQGAWWNAPVASAGLPIASPGATSQAPTAAKTLLGSSSAVPSTITSAQAATDVPDQPAAPPADPTAPTAPPTGPTNPTGPGHPGPITGPAPGAPPFDNHSPVPPTAPGAPGSFAPGSPNDPAWKGTDPAQAALNILNNPTSGGVPTSQLVDLINQHYAGAGALYYPPGQHDSSGNEYIGFPGGYLARVPGGQWTYSARGPETAAPKSGTGTPVAPPQAYTPPTGPTAPAVNTAFQDAIRQQIMDRLKTSGLPVDENAAGISGAVSAAHDQATRAGEQERTALAERLYAQGGGGLNTNALTQQIQQSGEKVAQTTGGLRATLIMQEYGRKQQELDQLLSMATASGDAESARQIQLYQAQLQAELQREGISADLAKYTAYLNQNAAFAGLNG